MEVLALTRKNRLAAYDRGEIPSVTLDEVAARKRL
jgi:hypothetical protein